MDISEKAFKQASKATGSGALDVFPDRVSTGPMGSIIFEWFLTTSTLKLTYGINGKRTLTCCSIDSPTIDKELNASNMANIKCHVASYYMQDNNLTPSTATPEDFANIVIALESKAARATVHAKHEQNKNDRG